MRGAVSPGLEGTPFGALPALFSILVAAGVRLDPVPTHAFLPLLHSRGLQVLRICCARRQGIAATEPRATPCTCPVTAIPQDFSAAISRSLDSSGLKGDFA